MTARTRHRLARRPILERLEGRSLLSGAGSLDATFGSGGTVTTSFNGASNSSANALVIYPNAGTANDGKTVAVGNGGSYVELARYNTNGTLDSTFGKGGKVQTKFGGGPISSAALQTDGKIVVGGETNGRFLLFRYNTNGTLDTTFNGSGTVSTAFPGTDGGGITGLAIETVGTATKIVAVGDVTVGSLDDEFAVVRYNLDGTLDSSFGSGGEVFTNLTPGYDDALAVAVQPDGKIIAAGYVRPTQNNASDEFAMIRYNTDGSLDTTFGTPTPPGTQLPSGYTTGGGVVETSLGGYAEARAVALQSDGKIILAGRSALGSGVGKALVRYNTDGTLDSTFASGGIAMQSDPAGGPWYGVTVQGNGQIVVAGGGTYALGRYNKDGTLDTTFGSGGLVASAFGSPYGAVAIEPDGKIVVTGLDGGKFGVARYLD
jgi:uncharacterized delta-60 repeat protein